jgi:hypothetical protein
MGIVMNPFKKHDVSDFPGVYQPLSEYQRHPSVVATAEKRRSTIPGVRPGDGRSSPDPQDGDGDEKHRKGSSGRDSGIEKDSELGHGDVNQYSACTIEGLRAEIEGDVAASGHDSMYDRKSKIINKAVQDIGMGSYQW